LTGRDFLWFFIILLMVGAAAWMALNPDRPIQPGLDLEGGLQVLLEADVPVERSISFEEIDTARQIISQRVNALGVAEPLVQVEGERRILVELPGIEDPDQAIALIQGTALLEFVDSGTFQLPEGMCIRTSLNEGPSPCEVDENGNSAEVPLFSTILTGSGLRSATTQPDQLNNFFVAFELEEEASAIFEDYTREHLGDFLTIVLDKQVISSPRISAAISDAGMKSLFRPVFAPVL
jgi:protein-export membrane protein SecD